MSPIIEGPPNDDSGRMQPPPTQPRNRMIPAAILQPPPKPHEPPAPYPVAEAPPRHVALPWALYLKLHRTLIDCDEDEMAQELVAGTRSIW